MLVTLYSVIPAENGRGGGRTNAVETEYNFEVCLFFVFLIYDSVGRDRKEIPGTDICSGGKRK